MKIHPDQIEGVRQQEQQKTNKTDAAQQAFGDVLGQEVSKTGTAQATGVTPPPPGITVNPLLAPQAVQAVSSVPEGQALAQVEQALDSLEQYASRLGNTDSDDLRQAYAALEDFQSGMDGLKDAAQGRPELQAVVDELEVLALTEQMKFNRGDYH